jgi:hypothetical protein
MPAMTSIAMPVRYVLVLDPHRPAPSPRSGVRRLRLARINPAGAPARDRTGYPHLRRVYD